MGSRLVLAAVFGLVSSSAFGAPVAVRAAGPRADLGTLIPQGAVTLTPTATLTAVPTASASPTLTETASLPLTGCGDCGAGGGAPPVPTLSPGMLALLALGLATFAILLIRRA